MTNSASITVTNHRLKKAMSNANDDDLKAHSKRMGEKLKSELKLQIGEIIDLCPDTETATVKVGGSTETCLIAHNTFSEGMSVVGYPKGKTELSHKLQVITPSEKLYGVVCTVDDKGKDKKVLLNIINRNKSHNLKNTLAGEYKMQVGDNEISLTDKRINIKSDHLFINGLPYVEANEPLEKYDNSLLDKIYPVGSVYISVNDTNPSELFGGKWARIKDTFLLASGSKYSGGSTGGEAEHTLTADEMPSHNHMLKIYNHNNSGTVKNVNRSVWTSQTDAGAKLDTEPTGNGVAHNNMPPYLAVFMWKRTE